MHHLAVQVEQDALGANSFFGGEVPPPDIYPKAEKTNLNVENARVKCTLPPHVVSAVVVLVTTDVEAHGITA